MPPWLERGSVKLIGLVHFTDKTANSSISGLAPDAVTALLAFVPRILNQVHSLCEGYCSPINRPCYITR